MGSPGAERLSDSITEIEGRIRSEFKRLREALSYNQSEFGEHLGAKRFTVNRIERGATGLRADMAKTLDRLAAERGIVVDPTFEALVANRTRLEVRTATELQPREVATRLLQIPELRRIHVVLADDFDFAELLRRVAAETEALEVRVVVPSVNRIEQLLLGVGDGKGDDSARYLSNHVDQQAQQLWRLAALSEGIDMSIIESDLVTSSLLIAQTPRGSECAFWPSLPPSWHGDSKRTPVATSVDPEVVGWYLRQVETLVAPERSGRLILNETLARLGEDGSIRFTRFVEMGPDAGTEPGEGYAVALVLPYAETVDRVHGVGRRALLERRLENGKPDPGRRSLMANKLEEVSLWETLPEDQRDQRERSWDTQASTIRMFHALAGPDKQAIIGTAAFEEAARRELQISFGLEVKTLKHHPLPDRLRMIKKKSAADIIPCLFSVELDVEGKGRRQASQLTQLREAGGPSITEVGYEDLLNSGEDRDLNDFLGAACGEDPWFRNLLVHELRLDPR